MATKTIAPKTNLAKMSLAELKKTAKSMNITGLKDWGEDEYRKAIGARQRDRVIARVIDDLSQPIQPGYARIEIPHFGEENPAPIPLNFNGTFKTMVPLNTVVELPYEVVDSCLGDATSFTHKEQTGPDGNKYTVTQLAIAYPYREYGRDDSISVAPTTRTKEEQGIREKFRSIYHRWPKSKEARDFKDKINELKLKELASGNLSPETKAILTDSK